MPISLTPSFQRIARFAPIIGLIIGMIQSGVWIVLTQFGWDVNALALISIAIGMYVTGGLHIDGLIDTADGIAAGKEKCLEAMTDSRVGASGVTAILIVVLLQLAGLLTLDMFSPLALPIASFWGRCSPLIAIQFFPYLHSKQKKSFHHSQWKGLIEFIPTTILLIMILCLAINIPIELKSQINLFAFILLGIFPCLIVPIALGKRLGGHTGDSYGASVVIVETITLLMMSSLTLEL